nr:MAG TPA: hypothetical protein [Caudoviricetes sp.]
MRPLAIPCVPFLLRSRLTLSNIIQPIRLIVKKLARVVGYLCFILAKSSCKTHLFHQSGGLRHQSEYAAHKTLLGSPCKTQGWYAHIPPRILGSEFNHCG